MSTLVVKHVAFRAKRPVTVYLIADEGSGILMDTAMYFEVLLLTEALATGGKLALKGLSPIMKV